MDYTHNVVLQDHLLTDICSPVEIGVAIKLTRWVLSNQKFQTLIPKVETIAKACDMSEKTCAKYLDSLQEKGVIHKRQRRVNGKKFSSNFYLLNEKFIKVYIVYNDGSMEPFLKKLGFSLPNIETQDKRQMLENQAFKAYGMTFTPMVKNCITVPMVKNYGVNKESYLKYIKLTISEFKKSNDDIRIIDYFEKQIKEFELRQGFTKQEKTEEIESKVAEDTKASNVETPNEAPKLLQFLEEFFEFYGLQDKKVYANSRIAIKNSVVSLQRQNLLDDLIQSFKYYKLYVRLSKSYIKKHSTFLETWSEENWQVKYNHAKQASAKSNKDTQNDKQLFNDRSYAKRKKSS